MRAIFVSYRRDDSEGAAGRLFDDLVAAFGEASVFMDVAGIEAGRDFRKAIDESVASCGVLLAVIGKRWVDARNDAGLRRLDDPYDFVRLETASALKRDIPVIPVLVGGSTMPRADQLPEDLKELVFRNAVELTHARWNSDLQLLIKSLRPHVGGSANVHVAQSQAAAGTAAGRTATAPVGSAATSPGLEAPAARKRAIGLIVGGLAAVLAIGAVAAYMMLPKQVTVPDLIGNTLPDASAKLKALQLAVGQTTPKDDATKDSSTVLSQSPSANSTVKSGTSINLVISQKPQSSAMVEVPSLLGKSLDAAKQALEDRQLTIGNIATDSGSDKPKDTVLGQFPGSGQKAQLGTKVDVKVATGKTVPENPGSAHPVVTHPPARAVAQSPASAQTPVSVEIPSLVGKSLHAAKQALEDRQLTLGNVATDAGSEKPRDTVLEQFPSAGQRAQLGAKVDLKVAAAQPAAEKPTAPQTALPQNSASGQQLGSNAFPNFAGTWELIELSYDGRGQSIASGQRFRITQNEAFVRFGNGDHLWPSLSKVPGGLDFRIADNGSITKVAFFGYDERTGQEYAVSSERQAAFVIHCNWQLVGPTLVEQIFSDFRVAVLGNTTGKHMRIRKFRRVAP